MITVVGYVIQFASSDGKHWTDWFDHVMQSDERARTTLKYLRKSFRGLTFRLITRETTIIEHEVKE